MPFYKEQFPKGSAIRVKEREALESFKMEWHCHNPLQSQQLAFAGREGRIASGGFYHGGDMLYSLEGIPGAWHEQCLEPPQSPT